MLEDPRLGGERLAAALRDAYGIEATSLRFVRSYDPGSAAYVVTTPDGHERWFLKAHFGTLNRAALEVPAALREAGIESVLAPVRAGSSEPCAPLGELTLVVYPFVAGRSAVEVGLTDEQWRAFGAALRAVHDSGVGERFAGRLPVERFELPSAASVKPVLERLGREPARNALAHAWREYAEDIGRILARAGELGERLQARPFERVLCHADIHAANVLVADDGRPLLVDWETPLIAPRERDLLFIIGGKIARHVRPEEEARFFEGYGAVTVDREAITYFRYERVLEDLAVDAPRAFEGGASVSQVEELAELTRGFFAPGQIVDSAELVEPTAGTVKSATITGKA